MPPSPSPSAFARGDRPSPTVSVVIPALNEVGNLPLVLDGLPRVDEVVVVDGGSSDGTVAAAREVRPDAVVVRQTRSGKGNALVCGFAASTGDIVVTLNADGSNDPGEIVRLVAALQAGADAVHGSRYRQGGVDLADHRGERFANAILSKLVNLVLGTRFTDLGSGYNAYWRSTLRSLDLPDPDLPRVRRAPTMWADGAEIEALINIRMAARRLRVAEVASVGYPRIHGTTDGQPLRHVWRALRVLLFEVLRRRPTARRTAPRARPAGYTSPGAQIPAPRTTRTVAPAPYLAGERPYLAGEGPYPAGERPTGRHAAAPEPEAAPRRRAVRDVTSWTAPAPGAHRSAEISEYDAAVRPEFEPLARYTGAPGTERTGAHRRPEAGFAPRSRRTVGGEMGGGRGRSDARHRRIDGRPDLTVIRGEGGTDAVDWAPEGRRTGYLRALPGERFTR